MSERARHNCHTFFPLLYQIAAAEHAFPLRWMDDAIPLRNRVLVLLNWAWNYVTFRRSVRLILPGARRARGPGRGGGW